LRTLELDPSLTGTQTNPKNVRDVALSGPIRAFFGRLG
jgi:hypothetical protein